MAYPKPIDLNKFNKPSTYRPSNIPLVAQQAIAAAHTGGSIPPMPKAAPSVSAPKDPFAAYGGKEHYAQSQQSRYNTAVTGGDTDTIGKLEADAQRAGYTLNKPAMPQSQPQPQPAIAQAGGSVATTPMPAMPNSTAIAAAEQARYLAERQRIANEQKAGLTRAFDRSNEILGENRTLEDARISRTLNPFSGRTSYAKGLTERERTLADESAQGNFNAAIQGVEQGLANDRNTAAQEIMARAYQLDQDAKDYDLRYAGVYGHGQNGGPRTLEANRFDRGVYEDNRDFDRGVLESDRNYGRGVLESDRDFGRQLERDARGDFVDDRNFDFQKGRNAIEDQRYDEEFDYRKAQDKFDQDYRSARDKIADERYKQEFDLDVKYRGLDYAMRKAEQNNQLAGGGGGTSDKALATAAKAENGGKAPGSFQSSPTFQVELNDMLEDPATAIQYLRESEKEIIQEYGKDGFNALFNAIQAELTRRGMVS